MQAKKKILTFALLLSTSVGLAACAGTAGNYNGDNDKIDSVLAKAANQAQDKGEKEQSLAILEQIYKRNSDDPQAALKYAKALRHEGFYNRASVVLKPFATDEKVKNANVVVEYASIQAAMGNYIESENVARQAVMMAPDNGQAYHVLGIALDAQGHHEQAHVAFEKALDHWQGDPSPLLNNMGLNLAAQGFLDEAMETLRKAMATAPNRKEIERNLRIVSALQYQPPVEGMKLVPKPPRKPDRNKKTEEAQSDAKDMPDVDAAPVDDVKVENMDSENKD